MSPSPVLRSRLRALAIISICALLVTFVSVRASRQHAGAPSRYRFTNSSITPSVISDKGGITPAAGTITVNSTSDVANGSDGLCTLREAITAANNNGPSGMAAGECAAGSGGTDLIDATTITGTVNLAGALPDITSSMTITGPGSSQLTVRRNTGGDYRIFTTSSGPISISGLTITNGKAPDGAAGTSGTGTNAGGLWNFTTLTLTDVALTSNAAGTGGTGGTTGGPGGHGGAIYNQGTLTLTNCAVSGNTAGRGGNGLATPGAGGSGGAIYNSQTLTVTGGSFTNNSAGNGGDDAGTTGGRGGEGGAIFTSGSAVLTNVSVSNNNAGDAPNHDFGGSGGASWVAFGGSLTAVDCNITGNRSGFNPGGLGTPGQGGAIFNFGTVLVTGSTISNNSSNYVAGGILNRSVASIKVENSTISGNTATNGGGIYNDGAARLTSCTITNNSPNGVTTFGTQPVVRNTIIAGNTGTADVTGTFNSQGHNLIGKSSGNGFTDGSNGDQVGTSASPLNPQLGPLANNGGPSQTHALLSTSPALDAGDNCVTDIAHCGDANISQLLTDQRGAGFGRMVDGPDADAIDTVDIGAFEGQIFVEDITDKSTNKDTQLQFTFSVSGASITSVTAASSNTTLVPNNPANIAVSGSGSTRTLTINPASGQIGTSTITVTVSGMNGDSITDTFVLSVAGTAGTPSVTNATTNEDIRSSSGLVVSRNAADGAEVTHFKITSITNGVLFKNDGVTQINNGDFITFAEGNAGLKFTPAANLVSPSTAFSFQVQAAVSASGTGLSAGAATATITVNSVNDAPSFTKGGDQTINEDAGAQTVSPWATSISPGPADESGQALTFQVTGNTNPGLFAVAPAISSTGVLTYTSAPNANGSATLTINLQDSGGTANGGVDTSASQTFTISVNPVNDAPSFTKGADQVVNEGVADQNVPNWATNISEGPLEGQVVSFTVTNNNNVLFRVQPSIGAAGTLVYAPAAGAFGTATVTVTLKDNGGTANGGVDTSPPQTFTITVNPVNNAPSFAKGADQLVNEDAGAQTVNNWATGIAPGPSNESSQTVSFIVTNNTNAALFSAGPAISPTGSLTYTPAADASGSATITLVIKDDGGTANGGADTSTPQTFPITVNSVNDAPSFTKGADQTVNNAGGQAVVNWATAIAAGPTNESAQTLTFQITNNTNSSLFSAGPTVSPAGTLAYFPASNAGGTATITIRLQDNGGTANGGIDTSASQSFNITVIPAGGFIDFNPATYNTTESSGSTTVTVKRTGDLTRAVTVDYASSADNGLPCSTANGVATPKCDFTAALGTLSFAAGEDTKVVNILVSQDGFVEGPETFIVALSNPTNNAALGTTATSTTTIADDATEPPGNVIDDARNFVRQHYHDFLNREPDQSGWDFWTNQITSCGSDVQCNEVRRIDVSASFFLSIEFQQTGYLVERFYKVGYGDATGNSTFPNPHTLAVPIVRANEFLTDTQRIGRGVVVLQPGWEQALENNKQAYALEFIQTARFTTALPTTMTPSQFVTKLNQNAGGVLTLAEQQTAINLFGGAGNTTNQTARAQAVRMVAEDQDLYNAEFNRAFVLAQYFGYLRRNANDAPDSDYTGYDFWLTKLNQFNGNYINAEMVKAFLSSIEYRQRFGP